MKLDEAQKQKISAWIAEGLKLSDLQKRIASDLGLSLTYMEARLLVDDLKLVPVDSVRPKEEKIPVLAAPASAPAEPAAGPAPPLATAPEAAPAGTSVSVAVDKVTRPGSLVSGTVRFSDGQTGAWYMDQMGRLGVAPSTPGYKPGAADVEAFQQALDKELSRLGM